MILRPYQLAAVAAVLPMLRDGRRVVLVAPTGSGKTVMGASAVASLGVHTRWTAHRRELIAQAREKLPAACDVFSVQERRTNRSELLVIDEAHHSTSASYRRHLDVHAGPVLGLTATPFRLDGKGLGEVFDTLHVATTAADLVAAGTLIEPRYYSVGQVDAASLHKIGGDFRQDEIEAAMNKPSVVGDAVREYGARAAGRRAVVFCVTVEHARNVAEAFRMAGHAAEVVSGDMPKGERDAVLARLRDGTTRIVANCMILTEGWDLPTLEVAIILRPTASLCLHLQMLGRVMRSADGKDGAIVLDHAGNVLRLGFATDPIDYTLDGIKKRNAEATNLKTCKACFAIVARHVAVCPSCGTPFVSERERDDTKGLGGTDALTEARRGEPKPIVYRPDVWERARLGARSIGYAKAVYKRDVGEWPIVSQDGRLLDPASDEGKKRFLFDLLQVATRKGLKLGWASHIYKDRYGAFPPFDWTRKYEAWLSENQRSSATS